MPVTSDAAPADLFEKADSLALITAFMNDVINSKRRPSASELVLEARAQLGGEAAWQLPSVVVSFAHHPDLPRSDRDYCRSLAEAPRGHGDVQRAPLLLDPLAIR